jgi:hypothetical protein
VDVSTAASTSRRFVVVDSLEEGWGVGGLSSKWGSWGQPVRRGVSFVFGRTGEEHNKTAYIYMI